jgi:hypothetical protein
LRPKLIYKIGLRDNDGLPKVALVGGKSKGMEFWNPADHTVRLVSKELPLEEGAMQGITNSQAVAINEGTEFILYSGNKVSILLISLWRNL